MRIEKAGHLRQVMLNAPPEMEQEVFRRALASLEAAQAELDRVSTERDSLATASAAVATERAALRAALAPFAACWSPLLSHYDQRGTPGWSAMGTVRIADLRAAHDLVGKTDGAEADPRPMHPGEHLRDVVLPIRGRVRSLVAQDLSTSRENLQKILSGERAVSPEMAVRLGRVFGPSARFWLAMQRDYDLWEAESQVAETAARPLTPSMMRTIEPDCDEGVYLSDGTLCGWIGPSKIGQGWCVQWPDGSNGSLTQGWATRLDAIGYLRKLVVPAERQARDPKSLCRGGSE